KSVGIEPSGADPPCPEMKIVFPGGDVTTCVYPGGFLSPMLRNCLFIFFAATAMEPNSSPAVSEASMLQIVVVRMSERISTWGPNRQAQVAVANIRQHHFANMRQHASTCG